MKKRILALLLALSMVLSLLPVSAVAETGADEGIAIINDPSKTYYVLPPDPTNDEIRSYNFLKGSLNPTGSVVRCSIHLGNTIGYWPQHQVHLDDGIFEGDVLNGPNDSDEFFIIQGGIYKNPLPSSVSTANIHTLTLDNCNILAQDGTTLNWPSAYIVRTDAHQTSVTVQATPPASQYFTGWTVSSGNLTLTKEQQAENPLTFTMPADDITLTATYAPYVTDLAISNGRPDPTNREPYGTNGCKGDGWTYDKDSTTLTLESGDYDFTQNGLGQLDPDVKLVVQSGAKLTGGVFNELPSGLPTDNVKTIILNGSGSIEAVNGLSSAKWGKTLYAIKNSQVEIKASVPLTDINCGIIDPSHYLDKNDKTTLRFTINDAFLNAYIKFSETELTLNKASRTNLIMLENGYPNREGVPYDWDDTYTYIGDGWEYVFNTSGSLELKDTRSYDFRYLDPLNKTGGKLTAVTCGVINSGATIEDGIFQNLVVNNGGTISGGTFAAGLIADSSTIPGTVTGGAFNGNAELSTGAHAVTVNDGRILKVNDTVPLELDNSDDLVTGTKWDLYSYEGTILTVKADTEISTIDHKPVGTLYRSRYPDETDKTVVEFIMPDSDVVLNDDIIYDDLTMTSGYPTASNGGKIACKGEGWEYIIGNPTYGDFLLLSKGQFDFGSSDAENSIALYTSTSVPDGSPVECNLFIGHGVAVYGGTFNGKVINHGGILGGTFNGAVENHGIIENGVFNGAVTNIDPGTVSDSITGTGTLNGKSITPNAYTLTITGGGLVNGKTSAVVEAGEEVTLTVGEMQEGMSFNYWDLPTALTQALTDADSGFSNKIEPLRFEMPDLSKYTKDTSFTIRLDIRPAELLADDDGPTVLGTMATVAVGGAAAGILVWQGVSLGVDSYLQLSLPDGVPVPANRRELVLLLWETAGKPDVVLPALYGDVSAEDAELQKATRWAIDSGLVKAADETDASRFDPDRSVSKFEVARAWFNLKKLMK